jgi:hypothetical protein
MKYSAYAVVAISLALFGCVEAPRTGDGNAVGAAGSNNKKIDVKIENGKIVVPEDPANATRDQGAIIWNLPATGSYTFPRDGILIDPGNFSPCNPIAGGKSFMCVKRGHKLGDYKYIVNVNDGSKPLDPLPLPPLDPWIFNR